MDERTIRTYDCIAKRYEQDVASFWSEYSSGALGWFASRVCQGSVLDVGSGPGYEAETLKFQNLDVTCLDASESMLALCRQRGLKTICADFLKMPVISHTFDGVWAFTSLIHVPRTQFPLALNEIHRVLKPQGTLGLGMIEGETEQYSYGVDDQEPRLFTKYRQCDLEDQLRTCGFTPIFFDSFQPRLNKYLTYVCRRED